MNRFLSALLIVSMTSQYAMADCPNAIRLKVGDTVKDCERIGLSVEYDQQVREDLVRGDFNKEITEEQKKIISLKDLQIKDTQDQKDLYKADALREREALDKERERSKMGFWVGLGAGIVLTVLSGWAIGQAAKR